MTSDHVHFEVLCALAVTADLTRPEGDQLQEHLEHCLLCHHRLLEMRRLGAHLFFVQARQTPTQRLPRGMQERFSARAISAGISLHPRSQGAGFRSLGMVTVVLVALLLVAGTFKDDSFWRPAAETNQVETMPLPAIFEHRVELPVGLSAYPPRARVRRVLNHHIQSRLVNAPSFAVFFSAYPAAQPRRFSFTPNPRDSWLHAYPLLKTTGLPESAASLRSAHAAPRLTLDATSEVFRQNAPHLLLAESPQ